MRRILIRLVVLALLFSGFWHFAMTPNPLAKQAVTGKTNQHVDAQSDTSLPLQWPPRAEDGRTESFFDALVLYFKTLFAADEIVQDARDVADKAAQRQQEIDSAVELAN